MSYEHQSSLLFGECRNKKFTNESLIISKYFWSKTIRIFCVHFFLAGWFYFVNIEYFVIQCFVLFVSVESGSDIMDAVGHSDSDNEWAEETSDENEEQDSDEEMST